MPGPLKGLKILDFTTLLPGPYATMMLADMGADVLRVLSGSCPDMASFLPPFLPGSDLSCNIAYLGRGKRCLNSQPQDQQVPLRSSTDLSRNTISLSSSSVPASWPSWV